MGAYEKVLHFSFNLHYHVEGFTVQSWISHIAALRMCTDPICIIMLKGLAVQSWISHIAALAIVYTPNLHDHVEGFGEIVHSNNWHIHVEDLSGMGVPPN